MAEEKMELERSLRIEIGVNKWTYLAAVRVVKEKSG